MAQRGLGRGLESLIPANLRENRPADSTTIPLSKICRNSQQPRRNFNEESIKELADSIKAQGLIQPLIVRPLKSNDGKTEEYELIAGERRWRACQLAGLSEVPVSVKNVTDKEQFQLSLIENIQREDLNPIEEAVAYKKIMEEFNFTQEDLSKTIGKARPVVANTLRLLTLPPALQDAVSNGTISSGHARGLVSMGDENLQKEMAEKIVREHLTVRDVERIAAELKGNPSKKSRTDKKKDPEIRELEESLQRILGTKVEIKVSGKGKTIKGSIKISYFSLEDLERLAAILSKQK